MVNEAPLTWWRVVMAMVLAVVALMFTLLALLLFVTSGHASHTNERADPSIWIDPTTDDGYVYHDDPCVEALRGAMEHMQPFLPTMFDRDDGLWITKLFLTDDGMRDFEEAHRAWEESKLQCFRH